MTYVGFRMRVTIGSTLLLLFSGCAATLRASALEDALLQAAREGNVPRVQALVREGARVDARDGSGETALLAATRAGQKEVVGALLRARANVNLSTPAGLTPLIEAAATGRGEIARLLIAAGAVLDARHRELGTALDAAQRNGHRELVAVLSDRGARGSGKSAGGAVCVEPWREGQGFCGVIGEAWGTSLLLEVTGLKGCAGGCPPDPACSDGRRVGGRDEAAVQVGSEVRVKSWCLTKTALTREP